MNDSERYEHRYFCDSRQLSSSVERTLDSLGVLTRIFYSLPITETIYLTYGQQAGYETPTGMMVRLRRYMAILSETIEVSQDSILLEIKRDDKASGINSKERVSVYGTDAMKALAGTEDHLGLRQRLGISTGQKLVPTGAMQSYRCHWVHQNGLRITFDKDVRFFLFKEGTYVARMVASLGEGKLEFKFPKGNGRNKILEEQIVSACGCTKRSQDHLERRARECITKYMDEKVGR
jgi:hypothetical protein